MSKFLNIFAPAAGGAATILTTAYFLADQFVTDMPAPMRMEMVSSANAQDGDATTVTEEEVTAAEEVVMANAEQAAQAQLAVSREGGFGLGREALPEEVAAWDIDVRPDGLGLPEGEGDVWTGEEVFIENCSACHGDFGEAVGRWPVLAGGWDSLENEDPVKTIGSYWPYLSTVYDYVHRAMPYGNAQSLEPDQVYAITAYLLYVNNLVEDDFVLSHENFADTRLPNEDGFFMDDRAETELPQWTVSDSVCMENCKENVEITMRAMVLDVTPEGEGQDEAAVETAEEEQMVQEAAAEEVVTEEDAPAEEVAATEEATAEATEEMAAAEEAAPQAMAAPDPELVADGARVWRQCQACHKIGEGARNGTGPQLNGIIGRQIAAVEDFRYSNVFQDAAAEGVVWTPEHIGEFLLDPRGTYRGTKMAFNGLRSEEDVAAILAYLQSEGG